MGTDGARKTPRKGRGAITNPTGRYERFQVAEFDDGWTRADEEESLLRTTVTIDATKSIIARNESPDVGFDRSINPYRGCEHGCVYCLAGETSILMGHGGFRALGELRVGDEIYGTERRGHYRRYVKTRVLAHWQVRKRAYRVCLADGTELVASADHRFLTERGWKFVDRAESGEQRPRLTLNNALMGFGGVTPSAHQRDTSDYRRGYLCGVIRGDGHLRAYRYTRAGRVNRDHYRFRLAMTDFDALERTASFLRGFGVGTDRFLFAPESPNRRRIEAIRTSARAAIETIERLIHFPERYGRDWARGFAAGIFDAEGSFHQGIVRIANTDSNVIAVTRLSLAKLGFDTIVETRETQRARPVHYVRVRGGLREHLRLFSTLDPSIVRKRDVAGQAVKSSADLRVVGVQRLNAERDLFDITTGTGDFIANGVISHNCFARPTHAYLGLSPGLDFETRLFAKPRAAELLEAELSRPGYRCKVMAMGTNTDPYQPLERRMRITRSILSVLARFRHPVGIVTKSDLVLRDRDILWEMAQQNLAEVSVSVTTLDRELARTMEPRAAAPERRLAAVSALREAGIPAGVLVAPVIPGINDREIEKILAACHDAGAQWAGFVLLRLPLELKQLFEEWLHAHFPDRASHVLSLIREMRGGQLYQAEFGTRMSGTGPMAALIAQRFERAHARLGFEGGAPLDTALFRPPARSGETLPLFG